MATNTPPISITITKMALQNSNGNNYQVSRDVRS